MFSPSQHDVRRFFCEAHRKHRAGEVLAPMEALAADWIAAHPEYHVELDDAEAAVAASYTVEDGRTNPFLHLSMHLSISEQVAVDQPRGIKQAFELLAARLGTRGAARDDGVPRRDDLGVAAQRTPAGRRALRGLRAAPRHALNAASPKQTAAGPCGRAAVFTRRAGAAAGRRRHAGGLT